MEMQKLEWSYRCDSTSFVFHNTNSIGQQDKYLCIRAKDYLALLRKSLSCHVDETLSIGFCISLYKTFVIPNIFSAALDNVFAAL
jgi:hypothetical protein